MTSQHIETIQEAEEQKSLTLSAPDSDIDIKSSKKSAADEDEEVSEVLIQNRERRNGPLNSFDQMILESGGYGQF